MTLNACFFHKRTAEHAAGEPLPGKDSRNCLTLPNPVSYTHLTLSTSDLV